MSMSDEPAAPAAPESEPGPIEAGGAPRESPQPHAPALLSKIEAVIEQWHLESFRTGAIAVSTETLNAAFRAKEDLKKRLAAILATND